MKKLFSRVFDNGNPPEFEEVKAGSALAIGLIGVDSAVMSLGKAHTMYGIDGMIGKCVSTSLRELGETPPPQPVYPPVNVADWPLNPLNEE